MKQILTHLFEHKRLRRNEARDILVSISNNEYNEAQIAAARRFYNSAVNDYNNSIDMFPSSVMASLMSLSPKPYFEARANERYAPRVSSHIGHP